MVSYTTRHVYYAMLRCLPACLSALSVCVEVCVCPLEIRDTMVGSLYLEIRYDSRLVGFTNDTTRMLRNAAMLGPSHPTQMHGVRR